MRINPAKEALRNAVNRAIAEGAPIYVNKPATTVELKMTTWNVEYTDTFGGDANYSWVRRATIEMPKGASNLAVMRKAKKAMGLSGLRGRTDNFGDTMDFRPYGMCTVMFVMFEY